MTSRPLAPALIVAAGAVALTSCTFRERASELAYVERPVEQLYNSAAEQLDRRDYAEAILLFNEVERQHPYSEWARRSMLMTAYANYRARDYDEAINVAQRYIGLHPGSEDVAYAYHIVAMSQFERIADVGRDQATTEYARDALNDVIRRFPESEYAKDARLKLDMVHDQLAGKEMEIGRWYLRRNQHLAAINRFRTVVEDYQTTTHTPEALHRLVEAYLSIGLDEEARNVGAVLGHNFPESAWYADSYTLLTGRGLDPEAVGEGRGWLSRFF